MSSTIAPVVNPNPTNAVQPKRVLAFIDGFNLYHALDKYDRGINLAEKAKYQNYKWLCLTSLVRVFLKPNDEVLAGVEYFTSYPNWNDAKRLRHATYVSAQINKGVHVIFGEFKQKTITCRAACMQDFRTNEEKQTDVNITTAMIDMQDRYDKLILLTADSDQVPALKLVRKLYPAKILALLPPIGRNSNELRKECSEGFQMTEAHLIACQLPNPLPIVKGGVQTCALNKPPTWP